MTLKQESVDKDLLSFLPFFKFLILEIISNLSGYSIVPKTSTRILQNLKIAIKNLLAQLLRKYFVTNFTCNESFGVNSSRQLHVQS